MLDDFKTQYCPHCNATLDMSQGYRPEECPFCKGVISYNRVGGTRKGILKSIKIPLQVQDALVILMVLLAVGVTIGYLLMNRGH